jgi:hypothetical protein
MSPDTETCPLIGTWQLLGMYKNTEGGGRVPPAAGWQNGKGFLVYTPDGRMFGMLAERERAAIGYPDIDDNKRIGAHKSMVAYTGRYDFFGDHVLHHVDIAWIPEWEGNDQRREVTLDGDRLTLTTPFGRRPDGSMASFSLEWQRAA